MSTVATAAPAVDRRSYGLWHYVWKLLRLRLTIYWSSFKRAKTRRKVSTIILGIFILAFAGFLFWISTVILNLLQSPEVVQFIDLRQVIASMPSTVISMAFFIFLLTNFGVLLQVLYLSNDMDFLLVAPVPMRAVFLAKLLQGLLPNFLLISLFALPLMFGLGAMQGFNPLYYLLVVIILATVSLLGAGISSLLVMAIVRVVPARRVAEILGFFGAVVTLLFSQSGQIIEQLEPNHSQIAAAFSRLSGLDQPWSPLAWAGRGLVSLGEGSWLTGALLLLLFAILAGGLFWGALGGAERLYYSGWARMQASPRRKKARKAITSSTAPARSSAAVSALTLARIPTPVQAIVLKDWRLLRRDLRFLSQLIVPLILSVVYAITTFRSIDRMPLDSGWFFANFTSRSMVYVGLGIPMFFGWTFLLNLTINAFSREGKSFWILKASPLSAGRLMAAKFIGSYLPGLVFQWLLFGFVLALSWPGLGIALYIFATTLFYVAGLTGINLTFGVYGARLDWEDPRRMSRGSSGCISSIAGLVYLAVAWGLFFIPPALVPILGGADWLGLALGLVLGGTFSLLCAIIPPVQALGRVDKIGMQ